MSTIKEDADTKPAQSAIAETATRSAKPSAYLAGVLLVLSMGSIIVSILINPQVALSNTPPVGKQALFFYGGAVLAVIGVVISLKTTARFLGSSSRTISESLKKLIDSQIAPLAARLDHVENAEKLIDIGDRRALIDEITKQIEKNATEDYIKKIEAQLQLKIDEQARDRYLRTRLTRSTERLSDEIEDLKRRGLINLLAGMGVTAVGVFTLAAILYFSPEVNLGAWQFFEHYAPRLTLIILIEVFAYFFLRLYKSNLEDIKFFQNEITNIEAKHLAIQSIFLTKEYTSLSSVLSEISKTERNRILEKGQSTVEIERARLEHDDIIDLVKIIADGLGSTSTKKAKDEKKIDK